MTLLTYLHNLIYSSCGPADEAGAGGLQPDGAGLWGSEAPQLHREPGPDDLPAEWEEEGFAHDLSEFFTRVGVPFNEKEII